MVQRKYTEARKENNKKWDEANLDRISIAIPKGQKEIIRVAAQAHGESINEYIRKSIVMRIELENGNAERSHSPEAPQKPVQLSSTTDGIDINPTFEHAQDDSGSPATPQPTSKPIYGSPQLVSQTGARLAAERKLAGIVRDGSPKQESPRKRRLPPEWEEAITGRRRLADAQSGTDNINNTYEQRMNAQRLSEGPQEDVHTNTSDTETNSSVGDSKESENAPTDLTEWGIWAHRHSDEPVEDWRKRVKSALPGNTISIVKHLGSLQEDERNLFLRSDPESVEQNRQREQERMKRFYELKALRDNRGNLSDREGHEYQLLHSQLRYLIEQRNDSVHNINI